MVGFKLLASVVACATMAAAAPTFSFGYKQCDSQSFYWSRKGRCLPQGGYKDTHPPEGKSCGKWYWHTSLQSCAPPTPGSYSPDCDSGYKYNSNNDVCEPSSPSNPNLGYSPSPNPGYNPSPSPSTNPGYNPSPSPNPGYNPSPSPSPNPGYNPNPNPNPGYNPNPSPNPGYNPSPSPNPGYNPNPSPNPGYNPSPSPSPNPSPNPGPKCSSSQFWWGVKGYCLPAGGPYKPTPIPKGNYCPNNWYWHNDGFCAPPDSGKAEPVCNSGYSWEAKSTCCKKAY